MSDDTTPSGRMRTRDSAKIKIKGKWTAIPNRLFIDQRLSRDARLLGCLLFMHAGNSGKAFPSQEEIAAELSFTAQVPVTDQDGKPIKNAAGKPITQDARREITVRSIQRWLSELRAAGWIDWRQTMRNNEYTLLDPSENDGDSDTESNDSSLNTALKGTTAVSPRATEGSPSNATAGSPRATEVSWWNTTEGSPSNTTEVSSPTTPLSHSSSYKDSSILDSSSLEAHADDDEHFSRGNRFATPAAPLHTETSRYLAEQGISTALEFRDLPLFLAERTWHNVMGRDSNATPGAVVIALRAIAAARAATPPEPDAEALDDDFSAVDAEALDDTAVVPALPTLPTAARAVGEQNQRLNRLWQDAKQVIESKLPDSEFDAWLRNTALLSLNGGVATIGVATLFQKEGLENCYLAPIRRTLGDLVGFPVQATIVVYPTERSG